MLHAAPMTANASLTFSSCVPFVCKIPSIYNGISDCFQASLRLATHAPCQLRVDSICICGGGCGAGLKFASGCQGLDSCMRPQRTKPREHSANTRQRDSTLATPDPPADSKTAGLVNQQLPYMVPTYVRPPPMFEKGEGCYMWDIENRKYLDFTAGIAVNALGHCDAGVAEVIAQQV